MGISLASIRQQMQSKIGQLFQWGRKYPVVSIVLILFMLPFFSEGWNIARVTYLVNTAARQGARQAATGQYDSCTDEDCSSNDDLLKAIAVDNARMASIHRVVHETLEDTSSAGNALGQTHITVCSSAPSVYDEKNDRCLPRDNPGEPDGLVLVSVRKDYMVGGALGSGVISLPIRAQQTMLVESFRMTRSMSVPPKILLSSDTSPTTADSGAPANSGSSATANFSSSANSSLSATSGSSNIVDTGQQLVVVTSSLHLIASDVDTAAETIASIAEANAGYVAQSTLKFDGNKKNFNIQIRVPADKFEAAFAQTKKLGSKVLAEDISRKDVTEEYVDLEARLRSLQATSDRVKEFLEKANTVNEALNVNVELGKIQEQIEKVTGRQKYLESQSVYAAIDIVLSEKFSGKLNPKVTAAVSYLWNPTETIMKAWKFLMGLVYFTGDVLIWIVIVALPIVLILWVLGKIVVRARKPKAPIEK